MKALAVLDDRGEQGQISARFCFSLQALAELVAGLRLDGPVAIRTVLNAEPGKEQAQKMIDFGDRGDGALAATATGALLDADRGRNAGDEVDIGPGELLDELAGISVHRIQKAALSFGKQKIEGKRALARTADACDDDKLVARNRQRDIF